MKTIFLVAATLGLAVYAHVQLGAKGIESPKGVLREFLKMELAGVRLTATGSSATAHFFVLPKPPVSPQTIFIVSDEFELSELPSERDTAKISVFFNEYYGKLSSTMRFIAAPKNVPGGGILKKGISSDYKLIATEKSTPSSSSESERKETTAASDWKIVNVQAGPTIDIAAAIAYVKEIRSKTSGPAIKSNADTTLANLAKLH